MKPILFNGEMVRAILDGRKTETRRVLKISSRAQNIENCNIASVVYPSSNICGVCADCYDVNGFWRGASKPLYLPGDILYVRETFGYGATFQDEDKIYYRADNGTEEVMRWVPSIHMPKEAARIFMCVANVRVERLQDITTDGAKREGAENAEWDELQEEAGVVGLPTCTLREFFGHHIWDRTLQGEENYKKYGWSANPWVWVYTFERLFNLEGKQ